MKTWPKVKLGDVCAINPKVQSPDAEALISVVPMSAVSETGEIDASAVQPFGDLSKGLTLFQEGDVLFAKITPCMENGKGAVAVGLRGGIGAGSTEFFVLRPDSKRVSSAWIYHFTKREAFRRLAAERMTGSGGQRRVPRVFLECVTLPLPALAEQERIAAELDAVAATLKKRQAQLAELDALVESRFVELFGDPATNPKGWAWRSLKELCLKLTDGTHYSPESFPEGDYKYITAKNIKAGGFDFSNLTYIPEDVHREIYSRCNPEKGDVLYIKDGATTGVAMVNDLDEEFSLLSSVALLKQNRSLIDAYYLRETLNHPQMYRRIRNDMGGAAISRLTISKLCKIEIPLPPLELQERFAAEVARVEAIKAKVRDGIAETQTLFDALTQKYFG